MRTQLQIQNDIMIESFEKDENIFDDETTESLVQNMAKLISIDIFEFFKNTEDQYNKLKEDTE